MEQNVILLLWKSLFLKDPRSESDQCNFRVLSGLLKQDQTPAVLGEAPSTCTESRAYLPRARVAVLRAAWRKEGRRCCRDLTPDEN